MSCTTPFDGVVEALERLRAARPAPSPVPSIDWPAAWGLDHLALGERVVSRPHRQVHLLDAQPADPAWLSCPRCGGSAWEATDRGVKPCSQCAGLHQRIEAVRRSGLPASAAAHTLGGYDFDRPGVPADLKKRLWACAQGRGESPGLMLVGTRGVGKTHLAHGLALLLAAERGEPARVLVWPDYLDRIRATFDGGGDAQQVRDAAAGCPGLLVLDDVGAERATAWTVEEATKLVDARYRDGGPVLVTTNCNPGGGPDDAGSLAGAVGPRAHSRLMGMCEVVALGGTDRRIHGH